MGDYEGQLISENYAGQVAEIRTRLDAVPQQSKGMLEAYDPGIELRLQSLLDHVLVLTSTTSPEIVPIERPGQLTQALNDVRNALHYLDEPATLPSYLPALVNTITGLSNWLWTWQGSMSGGDWRDAVTCAATLYRRSAGQQFSTLTVEVEQLREKVETGISEMSNLSLLASEHSTAFEVELASFKERSQERLATLGTQITALQAQVTAAVARQDQAVQTYQEQFSTSQERRGTEFTAFIQDSKDSFTKAQNVLDTASWEQINNLRAEVDNAKELVSVFAGAGTANAYGKEAKEQEKAANIWRLVAIALAIVGASAGAVLLLAFGSNSASSAEITAKLAVAVVIAGAAGYAASQSSAHRKREVINRRAELLLVSFEPFVRDLPTEDQDKARVTLLQTLLTDSAHVGAGDDGKAEPMLSSSQLNLFKQFYDIVNRR